MESTLSLIESTGKIQDDNINTELTNWESFESNQNKYGSFSDERPGCDAKIFIYPGEYMSSLYDSLIAAKNKINICGWAISPELWLKRPVTSTQNLNTRLMDVLKFKAEEGVIIQILLYKEVPATMPNDSKHTKSTLNKLHPNIKVVRHPKNSFMFKKWSNHEKIVIIDERIAYVGGIDLFWGRWDTEGNSISNERNSENSYNWPGYDYSNDRISDKTQLSKYLEDYIDRSSVPRMPWHDVSVMLTGPIVIDVSRHFIQRWTFRLAHQNKTSISYGK